MKAVEEISQYEESRRLMRLADYQEYFTRKYSKVIEDENLRGDFRSELIYLVHLVYREAQEPLVKQLVDFVALHSHTLILDKPTL